jgi:hypothetical protein
MRILSHLILTFKIVFVCLQACTAAPIPPDGHSHGILAGAVGLGTLATVTLGASMAWDRNKITVNDQKTSLADFKKTLNLKDEAGSGSNTNSVEIRKTNKGNGNGKLLAPLLVRAFLLSGH